MAISLGCVSFDAQKIEDYENLKDKLLNIFSGMNLTQIKKNEKITLVFNGKTLVLEEGQHFTLHI